MKKLILLLDDRPEIAKVITLYLFQYNVKYIENPIKALEWLKDGNTPDLIISDINMPEMNGEEFLYRIKTTDTFKHIPVFILSSVDGYDDRIRLLKNGADDFILKPFNPEELIVRIKRVLG